MGRVVATIVEGHGEVAAVPILLRRLAERLSPDLVVGAPRPIRIGRYKILKAGELERAVELAARRAGADGCILILLDAEDDCPAELGPELLRRARSERSDCDIRVVLAKAEYEAWFLAACDSIAGNRGIAESAAPPPEPESIKGAKGWLSARMPSGQPYRPTLHQSALTAIFDLDTARMAPSFDKLWRDVSSLLAGESTHDQERLADRPDCKMLPAAPGSPGRQEMKPFIRQLVLKGFRSIPAARIEFDNPTILVGRNASGKSNIVSAFSFLADAMRMPLPTVFDRAGGFVAVRNRSSGGGRPPNLAMRVDFQERRKRGLYAFEIGAEKGNHFSVLREQCVLYEGKKRSWFDRKGRRFDSDVDGLHPSIDTSSLALPLIGGAKAFNWVWRALSRMRRYSIEPGKLRGMQEPDAGVVLLPDGANAASVLARIESRRRDDFERLSSFLEAIVPNTRGISVNRYGKNMSLEITQTWGEGAPRALRFEGFDMSDGTLRAIGLLAAVFQRPAPMLTAVEEPEATIHSGALGAVLELLWEASERMQVIITTHSPELLDRREVADRHLRMVEWSEGVTRVGPVSDANRSALREGLAEAGGLLRANALEAAPHSRDSVSRDDLFEDLQ